jgi:sulfofructose kinase
MTTPLHIICLGGSATIDQIFYVDSVPLPSAKISASEFVITGGGVAANAAVAIQRLGGMAAYWGRVGQDSWGDQVLVMLAKEGVNIQYLRQLAGYRTKVSTVLIDKDGERLVVSAQSQGYPDVIDWLPLQKVSDAQAVLADTRWLGGAKALLDAAAQHGLPSVLDGDSGDADAVLALMLAATHPVLSEPMLAKLSGINLNDVSLDEATIGAALSRCFGGRNVLVGVTLGGQGVYWFDGHSLHHAASPKVAVVDTLAAGDTWHGALALALAQGQPINAAIHFASNAAALKCTRRGGRLGIPTAQELHAFIAAQS